LKNLTKWFNNLTEAIAAGMLAAIFLIFMLQIVLRYFFTPAGWTLEFIGILWVWVIFFSCAFIVREQDQVRFDILYLAAPRRVRQIMSVIAAIAIIVGMLYAFMPTWDYIDWMKIRKTATVRNPFTGNKIPMRDVFVIYSVFMIAVSVRYAWQLITITKYGPPKTELEVVLEASENADEEGPKS